MNYELKIKKILYLVIFASCFFAWNAAQASFDDWFSKLIEDMENENFEEGGSVIKNNISATANTGGNTAEGGEVIEGEVKSSVKIKTEVNGEILEDIEEEKISSSGNAEVKVESRTEVNDDKTQTVSTTTVNGGKEVKSEKLEVKDGESSYAEVLDDNENGSSSDGEGTNSGVNQPEESENAEETDKANVIAGILNNIFAAIKNGLANFFKLFT